MAAPCGWVLRSCPRLPPLHHPKRSHGAFSGVTTVGASFVHVVWLLRSRPVAISLVFAPLLFRLEMNDRALGNRWRLCSPAAPIFESFCTIRSIFSLFGMACASVIRQQRRHPRLVDFRKKFVTDSFAISAVISWPQPLNTTTRPTVEDEAHRARDVLRLPLKRASQDSNLPGRYKSDA